MCTVTYIPTKEHVYLTSNRDEKNWRTDALAPEVYEFSSGKIIYPKDGDAGGTWIAAHENGNVVVFLNGGFVAHTPAPPYRKSRGSPRCPRHNLFHRRQSQPCHRHLSNPIRSPSHRNLCK